MQAQDLEVVNGADAGAWIRPRLGGRFGAVTREVPKGLEAYARIFHPASDRRGDPVRWAEVADVFGTTAHREMQWHALLGFSDPSELRWSYGPETRVGRKWTGQDPSVGALDLDTLDVLCEVLAAHTLGPTRCYFGDRDYIVLSGPLAAVDPIVRDWSKGVGAHFTVYASRGEERPPEPSEWDWITRGAPNLIWPADRSWFVASEVEPTDSLAADADKINAAPTSCDKDSR